MKLIPLTQGLFAQVDDEVFDYLNQFKWCAVKIGKSCYSCRGAKKHEYIDGKCRRIFMHRFIWEKMKGPIPKGEEIDHQNHYGLNNLIENLQCGPHSDNMKNRSTNENNTSNYTGVRWNKRSKKWYAYIMVNYERIHLYFGDSKEDAIAARKAGKLKYHGKLETNS